MGPMRESNEVDSTSPSLSPSHEGTTASCCALAPEPVASFDSDCTTSLQRSESIRTWHGSSSSQPDLTPRKLYSCYSYRVNRIRESIYWATEEPDVESGPYRHVTRAVAVLVLFFTVSSLLCFILETMPSLGDEWAPFWSAVEVVTTFFFTAEYFLRLWASDILGGSSIDWALRPINICELIAVMPLYMELAGASEIWKSLRVLRVCRLFKVGRYSHGVSVMSQALTSSLSALYIMVFLFITGMFTFAATVYYSERLSCPSFYAAQHLGLEEFLRYNVECAATNGSTLGPCCHYECFGLPETFNSCTNRNDVSLVQNLSEIQNWKAVAVHSVSMDSVATGMWWACVTMTTVGYGDIVPESWISKMISSTAMLSGMLIIAVPFAIIGTKFGEAVKTYADPRQQRRKERSSPRLRRAPFHRPRLRASSARAQESSVVPSTDSGSLSFHSLPPTSAPMLPSVSAAGLDALAQFATGLRPGWLQVVIQQVKKSHSTMHRIRELQIHRNNLWTSVEHAMAEVVSEALLCYEGEMLCQKPSVVFFTQSLSQMAGVRSSSKKIAAMRFCTWSCCVFHRDYRVRKAAIWFTQDWPWFDRLVLVVIIINSIILALYDYYEPLRDEVPWMNRLHDETTVWFTILFTLECVAQIIARGFVFDRASYLRDPWNVLDFLVVVSGWVALVWTGIFKSSSMRAVRVLRPLRSLSTMPGMRPLVNTVVYSLPRLSKVVMMFLFLVSVFAVLGLHIWGGVLHRLCRVTPQPLHFTLSPSDTCSGWCFDHSSLVEIEVGGRVVQVASDQVFNAFCWPVEECRSAFGRGEDYYVWPVDTTQETLGDRSASAGSTSAPRWAPKR